LFNKQAAGNTEILHKSITGIVLISAWCNRTKKFKTHTLVSFEMSGGCFGHISMIAAGMIADCILGADFLDKFQVIIKLEGPMHVH
jgi:hypothetical protein